jgi:hypothetical protein
MLLAKNIRQLRPNKKLSNKFLGPFTIREVVSAYTHTYRLKLPAGYRIYNVFYVSLLEL